MTPLENRLVLHRFVCREFGYRDLPEMLDRLRDLPSGRDESSESAYAQALALYMDPAHAKVTPELVAEYDANIVSLSRKLRMAGEHGRSWKPHQYLALLFTEHYLSRYFGDAEKLRAELNEARRQDPLTQFMSDYTPDDLRTIAFQSATGSGKTLIMHAHILQYRHWLGRAGGRLNNVVLLTPNEQMSAQHERELRESGLHARLFSSEAGADLFAPVEIIDLNKLAERKGIKRVAVRDFGENNLVLVDEGHLGASGKVWRERRGELARGGFAFEYSATFNQVAAANTEEGRKLRDAYGKCLLFDYPYRRFHEDGYGKDYAILNLPGGAQDENAETYLLGCLLTFYQQCRIWRDKGAGWAEFNVAKPLWVFLGKTVTGRTKADEATRSDVAVILDFLGRVLARPGETRAMIERLLAGQSGLTDDTGADFFAGRFDYLWSERPNPPGDLYADVCETLFHGRGRLHVAYLTAGEGELHLRSADGPVFGVVNVGDSAALYRRLTEGTHPDLGVEREAGFAERLFAGVDRPDSTVNVVIGARRFIAGWNSWRVSTMGLMHVGVGEGPEIIQMFGRGVRLKGWNLSLKRHRRSGAGPPLDGAGLAELEKLYIFGLRANYMQTFRELLAKDGIPTERETIRLPVTWNFARKTDLKMLRLAPDRKYELSGDRPVLPGPGDEGCPPVTLDLYSRLHFVASNGRTATSLGAGKSLVKLRPVHTACFDRTRVYHNLLRRKRQRGWHNLTIEPETVDRLLADGDWYDLYAPPERLNAAGFRQVRALEDVAVDLLTEYAEQFWRSQRRRWERGEIEVKTLDEDDPNKIGAWELSVDATQTQLVEDVRELASNVQEGDFHGLKLSVLLARTEVHAYRPLLAYLPLLHAGEDRKVTVQPVPLDENEKKVVEGLAALAENADPCLEGRELFLIRNRARGRGVSFFDDFGYYPDFIIWLKDRDGDRQHVAFLDPKGLSRFGGKERRKVELHHRIVKVEARLREADPNLRLHAYVLSVTAPALIDDGRRSANDWKRDGVYFLDEPGCLKEVVEHALTQAPAA